MTKEIQTKSSVLVTALICLLGLSGCSSHDGVECYQSVLDAYPDANIHILPGEQFRFLVTLETGESRYVKTMSPFSSKISHDVEISGM